MKKDSRRRGASPEWQVAEAGLEHITKSPEKTAVGRGVVQKAVQVPADAAEIAVAAAGLSIESRAAVLAMIEAAGKASGTKRAKR